MKHLITIAIVLSTATAFASSRARTTALGNSVHIADFYSPENLLSQGELLRIETGKTTPTTAVDGAEGTLHKSLGDGKLALSLGHLEGSIYNNRAASGIAGIVPQQNALNVSYGWKMADMTIGAGLLYSNYDNKVSTAKESSMGIKAGVLTSAFYARGTIILTDKYELGADTYKGASGFDITGGMNFGDLSVHANVMSSGYKVEGTGPKDVEMMNMSVKLVETIKKDGNEFFYGVGLATTSEKDKTADVKTTTMNLPLIIGLEAAANSWLTLRASVSQDVLISDSKTTATAGTTAETTPGLNTTTFAAGAGIAFNKIVLDGSIMNGGTQQEINANNLLAQVGLTYNF